MFNQTADGKGKPYEHQIAKESNLIGPPFEILSKKAVEHYEKLQKKGENIYIDKLTYDEFMLLGELEMSKRFTQLEEANEKDKLNRMQDNELEYAQESVDDVKPSNTDKRAKQDWEDTVANRVVHWNYNAEQKTQVQRAMENKLPKSLVLSFFYPETPAEKMEEIISQYLADNE